MSIDRDESQNRYVKGAVIAWVFAFGAGIVLWCLGVVVPVIYLCVAVTYLAFALQIVLATSPYGPSRTFASIGVILLLSAVLFAGLQGIFYEAGQHGIARGFVLRWVS